jgi:hypothetical protein
MVMDLWFSALLKEEPHLSLNDGVLFPFEKICYDPEMSHFGNLMANELYVLELVAGIGMVHAEVLLLLLVTLLAGEAYSKGHRFHVLNAGPPASGKTYIQKVTEMFSVPELFHAVSIQTLKSNSTSKTRNGKIILSDELDDIFVARGAAKEGNAAYKTMLTEGVVHVDQCAIDDETHERIMITTEAETKSSMAANTNELFETLPESVSNRFYCHLCPNQKRPDISYVMENFKMKNDERRMKNLDLVGKRWRIMQCLAAYVFKMVEIGLMPDVDMFVANMTYASMTRFLEQKHGIDVSERDKHRTMQICKAIVVYDAILTLFFTDLVFPQNTPFEMGHLMKIIPFLVSKREHVFFAFSFLSDMVVDPFLMIILKCIHSYCAAKSEDDGKYDSMRTGRDVVRDFNYYYFDAAPTSSKSSILDSCASKVCLLLKDSDLGFSKSNIVVILRKLMDQKIRAKTAYNSEGTIEWREGFFQVIRVAAGDKHGMMVSRIYLETMIENQVDVIRETILSACDPHMDLRKIVMGETLRFGCPGSEHKFPFLFKVFNVSDELRKLAPLVVEKEDFKRHREMDVLGNGGQLSSTRYEYLNENLEGRHISKWCVKHCVPLPPMKTWPASEKSQYPEDMISGFEQQFVMEPLHSNGMDTSPDWTEETSRDSNGDVRMSDARHTGWVDVDATQNSVFSHGDPSGNELEEEQE